MKETHILVSQVTEQMLKAWEKKYLKDGQSLEKILDEYFKAVRRTETSQFLIGVCITVVIGLLMVWVRASLMPSMYVWLTPLVVLCGLVISWIFSSNIQKAAVEIITKYVDKKNIFEKSLRNLKGVSWFGPINEHEALARMTEKCWDFQKTFTTVLGKSRYYTKSHYREGEFARAYKGAADFGIRTDEADNVYAWHVSQDYDK